MPDDLALNRLKKATKPGEVRPIDAINACLAAMESGEAAVNHVFIAWSEGPDPEHKFGWFQGGDFNRYETMGMIEQIKRHLGG